MHQDEVSQVPECEVTVLVAFPAIETQFDYGCVSDPTGRCELGDGQSGPNRNDKTLFTGRLATRQAIALVSTLSLTTAPTTKPGLLLVGHVFVFLLIPYLPRV